jgi:hypothetical protein
MLEAIGRRLGLTPDTRGLVRLGVLTTLVYVALVFYPDRPYRVAREAAAWAALFALLFLHLHGARQLRAAPQGGVRWIVGFFALLVIAAVCVWPFDSADLYLYANAGHLESRYGLNPYVHVPTDVPGWRRDPMFTDLWMDQPFPYGFLFAHLARVVAWLGHGSVALTVSLFKVVNALALGVTGWLVFSTSRRLQHPRPDVSLYLLLFSPFLLIHHIANGHNDLLLGLFVVLALRLAVDGRPAGAVAALACGVLVKLVAAAVLPFVVVFLVRRHGWRRTIVGLVAGAAVLALVSWPYLAEARQFRWHGIADALTSPAYSLHAALLGIYRFAVGSSEDAFRTITQALLGAGFLVFVVVRVARAARRPEYGADDLIEDAVLSMIALTCVASSRFGPWYGAMFLPAALLLPEGHSLRRLALLLAAFELTKITFVGRARILDAIVMTAVPLVLWRFLPKPTSDHPTTTHATPTAESA